MTETPRPESRAPRVESGCLPVRKIAPSHDYIRRDGAEPEAGDRRPAEPEAARVDATAPFPPAAADDFVHLHVHSNFSFLDGGSRVEELVARAAELGQTALALTDHDGLYGIVRFAKACEKRGIKPIFGAEVRVESLLPTAGGDTGATADAAVGGPAGGAAPEAPQARRGRAGATAGGSAPTAPNSPAGPHHLVLLAENREGYANLCRLLTAAHLADPERERPPAVTIESLAGHAEGLICLTGCRHGQVGHLVDAGLDGQAQAALLRLRDLFGAANLYVELQYFGYEPHEEARPGLHGARVFEKIRVEGNRLGHRQTPAGDLAGGGTTAGAVAAGDLDTAHGTPLYLSSRPSPASRRPATRPDLPHGQPQRLNPADYDVGFHRDGRPWRLSCLTYSERLARLAAGCGLPAVLTTDAHYAREDGRALHLVCRAAGRDQPLSTYPDPVAGVRCLKSKAEVESFAAPLLELIAPAPEPTPVAAPGPVRQENWEDCDDPEIAMHLYCSATSIASMAGRSRGAHEQTTSPPYGLLATNSTIYSISDASDGKSDARAASGSSDMHYHCSAMALAFSAEYTTGAWAGSLEPAGSLPGAARRRPSPLEAATQLAARCNVDLGLGQYHFPRVAIPEGETAYSLLAKRCFRGIARMYRPVPPRAVELLEKELRMIEQMGFAHYFLVVHDIVRWARTRGVACSGRGSAGNSVVCHALDITASEPIRHNLLFERFLNPNRREMPDIDVDFCSSRRDEVIEHIYQTFGNENVAVVANVNTMSPRSAVRIVAEALGFAPTEINALAQHVPRHGDAARLREYLAGAWPELKDSPLQDSAPPAVAPDGTVTPGGRYWRLLDLAERLDAFPMHLGTHLGGFVIADRPITYYAPLQWAAKGIAVIQFNKDDVAALGLVKMDILGLRTHSAVSETVHLIRQRTGRRIRPYELPPDDPAAYEIVSNGGSIGLFQLESAGQRNLASRLQERDFDDVIAAIALYRPGPLEAEMIGPFIDRRWGLEPVSLPHPAMAEAVADTYGVILYQEQVLRIAQSVAGFDLADADSLRRAMTRDRSREEMAKIGETFIAGALARGVPEDAAREVFRQLEGFAAYGFNKSHRVCFAVISYATAWLKAYYPAEFLCSVLNNYPMGFYTPRTVLNDARRFGLEVRPLDINLSGRGFTVEDETPPSVWNTAGEPTPYDPFAQAWTAGHDWGLTAADLAELEQEQNGEAAYTDALRVAMEQLHSAEKPYAPENPGETQGANPVPSGPGSAEPPAASPAPDDESLPGGSLSVVRTMCAHPEASVQGAVTVTGSPSAAGSRPAGAAQAAAPLDPGRETPLHPGDVLLPRAPRARGGVMPGACLAPMTGIAPDAGRALRVGFKYLKQMGDRSLDRIEEERRHGPFSSFEDFYLRTRIDYPVAENLIRVGAFDSLEPDRTELLWRLPLLHDRLEALAGSSGGRRGQLRAFHSPPSRAGLERSWSADDKVRSELELLGLTVTCHPLQLYEEELRTHGRHHELRTPGHGRRGAGDGGRRLRAGPEPLDALGQADHVPHPGRRLRPLRVRLLRVEARQDRPRGRPGELLPRAREAAEQPQAGARYRG